MVYQRFFGYINGPASFLNARVMLEGRFLGVGIVIHGQGEWWKMAG